MPTMASPLTVNVWNTERVLRFSHTKDIDEWLRREEEAWGSVDYPLNSRAHKLRRLEEAARERIKMALVNNNYDEISNAFEPVRSGTLTTVDSLFFPAIKRISALDKDAAGMALISARSDAAAQFQAIGVASPLDSIMRFAAYLAVDSSAEKSTQGKEYLDGVARLKNDYDSALSEVRTAQDDLTTRTQVISQQFEEDQISRADDWKAKLAGTETDWAKLKQIYDTELGLRAPTTYWTDRAKSQRNSAIGYGLAFAVAIVCLISAFSKLGIGYFMTVPQGTSAVIAVLPVIIPAFAGIWVLRILGRLLSESLGLMRDARERETLVKTFLALMKDDSTGKSVVKEEDRILILHSLFRASSGAYTDDAPPVHWFDILASRVGHKGKSDL